MHLTDMNAAQANANLTYEVGDPYLLDNVARGYKDLPVHYKGREGYTLLFERTDNSNSGEEEEGDTVRVPLRHVVEGEYDAEYLTANPEKWFVSNTLNSNNENENENNNNNNHRYNSNAVIETPSIRSGMSVNQEENEEDNGNGTASSMSGGRKRSKRTRRVKRHRKIRTRKIRTRRIRSRKNKKMKLRV